MLLPLLGLMLGIILGFILPFNIPLIYSSYMSIAVLAALDSVFGGIRSSLEGAFDTNIFISGFFGNAILAAFLAYVGDRLGVPLYYAAIFAFGTRLFQNFAIIRRYFLKKITKK
ncbi:small basic family protein [Garciella nitratireducens]|uniref:small basic family protein n=1 Tax=Garciella nitratireducens TaxID=218205 RepID=UPI000DEB6157|nr:small basic family protein [Garciella nitratireducens]RBP45560.1 small basic protein [Garciella nitratireducens]